MKGWTGDGCRMPRAVASAFVVATAVSAALLGSLPAGAEDTAVPYSAREGVGIVTEAAFAWHPDAYLVYLENDEPLDPAGNAVRWGYLFYSPSADETRGYSVRAGEIVQAVNIGVQFKAPPLAGDWVDSAVALEAAENKAGRKYREKHAGRLNTILLMRGAFQEKSPDTTTWTLIYTAPETPSLFVVVDAVTGKVKRTWRG
jgi:hypothetical protein